MQSSAQVVIIGGGVVGTSCLYHLTQAGISDCLLIEKDELTSGSTWHAAGNIPTYANSWLGMRAGNYSWQLYKDLEQQVDSAITYRHTGAFWPAHNRERMELFNHLVGVSTSAGFDLDLMSPNEMEAIHPYYKAGKSVLGGIHDPYEGDIDPSQLTQALAKGAREAGAKIARFTEVTGIRQTSGKEWEVSTNKGVVTCETIVNASGFYGNQIAKLVGQTLPIAVLEHQYLVTDALQALEDDKRIFPLIRDPDIRFYLRRERASLLLGSYNHPGRLAFADGIPEKFAHSLFEDSVDDIIELVDQIIKHVPLLGEAGVQRFVNGPIGYTPDALPLCGPAYGLQNFYQACGIQIGVTHSAAVGKAITEWITTGETEWDYSAWDPRRFGDWADEAYARKRIVELYSLQYAIPYPHRIIQSGRPLQTTPLYRELTKKGAVYGQIAGWERAFWFDLDNSKNPDLLSFHNNEPWYEAVRRECTHVRDHVGVMDHGGFTKYEVEGPDATAYLDRIFCTSLPRIGRVKLAYMLTPGGRIWSEATIARLDDNRYFLCGPTLADLRDHDWLQNHRLSGEAVEIKRGSVNNSALLVMGPKSRELLSQLTDSDLSSSTMPWMSIAQIDIAGCPVIAMRLSYVGELGWELHLASNHLRQVYQEIANTGSEYNLVNFGSYSLNSMRLEKSYHAWGADFGSEYTMFDAGLEQFINVEKADFIGRDAVLKQRQQRAEWRFVRLAINNDNADPLAGDPIVQNGHCVGYVTSGGTGFRTDKCIALGYIRSNTDIESAKLDVVILGENRPAQPVEHAFYDPQNSRLRA